MTASSSKVDKDLLIGNLIELLPKRLYFASFSEDVGEHINGRSVFINFARKYHYDPFYRDFGPWNLSVLYQLCVHLNQHLEREEIRGREVVMYCVDSKHVNFHELRVNCAYMLGAYLIIYHGVSADAAFLKLNVAQPPKFIGFRDASQGESTYSLHVHDVLRGVERGLQHNWLDFSTFDPEEYEFYEKVENGDFNWIIPGKIISFCGPHNENKLVEGYPYHAPEVYFDYFREHKISTIVRLNKKMYDASRFVKAGFDHVDLFFVDGSTPTDDIVIKFIEIVDNAKGGVAIHCKAGLGRTGTLIACWMMKEFGLSAAECMAWLRICRPGSVIGPQQQFLIDKQRFCWSLSNHNGIHLPKRSPREKSARKHLKHLTSKVRQLCESKNMSMTQVDDMSLTGTSSRTRDNPIPRPAILSGSRRERRLPPTTMQQAANDTNGNPVDDDKINDETAIDSKGRSQGDRLLALKAKKQHEKVEEDVLTCQFYRGDQIAVPSQAYLNKNREPISPRTRSKQTVGPKTPPRSPTAVFPSIAARRSEATRFSSPTTPIKPMSPLITTRSRPTESTTTPRLEKVRKDFMDRLRKATAEGSRMAPLATRNISRCILSSAKSRAPPSTLILRKIQLSRPRPYPAQGVRVELAANSNIYDLRPRVVKEQAALPGATLPPNTEALIGRRRRKTFSS